MCTSERESLSKLVVPGLAGVRGNGDVGGGGGGGGNYLSLSCSLLVSCIDLSVSPL